MPHCESYKPYINVPYGSRVLVPTGLIFDIPEEYYLKVYTRSSSPLKNGLMLANSTGIIDSDDLLDNPYKELSRWCRYLDIDFDKKMLSWERGPHKNDGIWAKHWYKNIINSNRFLKQKKLQSNEYKNFESVYHDSLHYYRKIYNMKS